MDERGGHIPPEDEFVYPHVAYCVDHDVAGLGNVQPTIPDSVPLAEKIGSYTHSNSRYGYATVTYESSANTVNFINMGAATHDKNVWCFVSRKNLRYSTHFYLGSSEKEDPFLFCIVNIFMYICRCLSISFI